MSDANTTSSTAATNTTTAATTDPVKKKNGYHYWHGHGKERALVGDVAPMPVAQKVEGAPVEFDAVASLKRVNITAYSWCDNAKSVSVYVDFKGVGAIDPSKITTKYTDKTMRVAIESDGKDNVLLLHLSKKINADTSSHKVKPDQLVFKLVKDSEETWFDLTGAPAADADDE